VQRLAVQADRSIASADELLRALLNLSKLEAGKVEPDVQPVSVGDLLKELQREFLPIAEGKGLRLHCVGSTRWVLSDPSLLRSVLQNLIGNALSYTQRGRVLVGVRRAGGRIRIEVCDTGPGISDDVRGSIFREFTRGAAAGAAPGMGLGLAIVDRIGALLDHPIDLRSEVGAGSVFSVSLPVAPMRSLPNPQPNPTALLNGMRVLCIDDDPNILESIVALIGRWGGKTDKAASAEEAMLLGRTWDVALIDYHLGAGPTGAELIRRLGRHRVGRVAFVTAARDEEVIADARSLGVTILAKPLEPTTLRRFLTNARMMPAAE
jgi:CheY-like chemotaxis protein